MKLGNEWRLSLEDWIRLTIASVDVDIKIPAINIEPLSNWNKDEWFDSVINKKLRTEKEVETKFIIPLLERLGFNEDDRYDDMPISASFGCKPTVLKVDFALYNTSCEDLKGQVILTVEAKKENRLTKSVELINARNQVKSYSVWTGCYHTMITDSQHIEVYKISGTHKEEDRLLLSCNRLELKNNFISLYRFISKEVLTKYYLNKLSNTDKLI